MLKSRTLAYDGRGNLVVKDPSEAATAINTFGDRPLYAERLRDGSKNGDPVEDR